MEKRKDSFDSSFCGPTSLEYNNILDKEMTDEEFNEFLRFDNDDIDIENVTFRLSKSATEGLIKK